MIPFQIPCCHCEDVTPITQLTFEPDLVQENLALDANLQTNRETKLFRWWNLNQSFQCELIQHSCNKTSQIYLGALKEAGLQASADIAVVVLEPL
jgi:hypothetical protein